MNFKIIDQFARPTDACCQFLFKGKQISISTIGRSSGACATPVAIFDEQGAGKHLGDFDSVEEAINWIICDALDITKITKLVE